MSEAKKPGGTGLPWEEDSGSGQGLGATGVFGAVQSPEPESAWERELKAPAPPVRSAPPEPAKPPVAPMALEEPVLHKVVLGTGGAESSPDILDRMRAASAERAKAEERSAAPAASGSGGFTELLRTLGSEAAPAVSTATAPPKPAPPEPSGFTALLRTLETGESAPPPAPVPPAVFAPAPAFAPTPAAQPVFSPSAPAAQAQAAVPSSGGFTELLQTMPPSAPVSSGPAPGESKPGSFTQLFGTFGGAGASLPSAPAESRPAASATGSAPGSFTQMFALEQQPAASAPAFPQERAPLPGRVDYGQTPAAGPAAPAPSNDPFAQPFAPAPPVSGPPAGGVGITRLIQMLDEPAAKPQMPRYEPPPAPTFAPASSSTGAGVWTQTFSSLAGAPEPAVSQESKTFRAAGASPAEMSWSQPPASAPQAPQTPLAAQAAGPSEFTRILDASKLREQSLQGGRATGAERVIPAAPAPSAPPMPAPPQMQVPSYPMPQAPPMQGMGGMAQPPVYQPPAYQPPQMQPAAYSPMPMPQASLPQAPGMYAPPQMPQAPPAPQPPAAPAGGLQQYVPLMLVAIIVLLVVILVTVVFMMKH